MMDVFYMDQYNQSGWSDDDEYGSDDNKAHLKAGAPRSQASLC